MNCEAHLIQTQCTEQLEYQSHDDDHYITVP